MLTAHNSDARESRDSVASRAIPGKGTVPWPRWLWLERLGLLLTGAHFSGSVLTEGERATSQEETWLGRWDRNSSEATCLSCPGSCRAERDADLFVRMGCAHGHLHGHMLAELWAPGGPLLGEARDTLVVFWTTGLDITEGMQTHPCGSSLC